MRVSLTSGVVACSTLYGFDSPHPSLGSDDIFEVDPLCVDLPMDPEAIATVERVVTLSGRRRNSGLGAEGVPVTIRIGQCACLNAGSDQAGAGGADATEAECCRSDVSPADAGESAGGGAQGESQSCSGDLGPLNDADAALFSLTALEARGCRQRSPSRLDCNLDASGEAAFGVVGQPRASALGLAGYLPICISPLELEQQVDDKKGAKHQVELKVIPRSGPSRVALAAIQLEPESLPPGSRCDKLAICGKVTHRARFQAGFVSSDLPPTSLSPSDFRSPSRQVSIGVALTVLSGEAFLSYDGMCAEEAVGGAGPSVESEEPLEFAIASGQRETQIFYVCATGFEAEFKVNPTLLTEGVLPPILHSAEVELDPLTERFSFTNSGTERLLEITECGAGQRRATAKDVVVAPPLGVKPESGQVFVACGGGVGGGGGAPADGEGGEGAAAAGAGASGDAPAPECSSNSITLELTEGKGTCSFN